MRCEDRILQRRYFLLVAFCFLSILEPLHGQPPPPDLDMKEELLKLLLKDHPKVLANRKLIDELRSKAPAARLAERDLECIEIELKIAKVDKGKIAKEERALEGIYTRSIKTLSASMPKNELLKARLKAWSRALQLTTKSRRIRVLLVKKLKNDAKHEKLKESFWAEFLIRAHNVRLHRARINLKQSDFGKTKRMDRGAPEEAIAKLTAYEDTYCKKKRKWQKIENDLVVARAESVAAEENLRASIKDEKVQQENVAATKAANNLMDFLPKGWANKAQTARLEKKQRDFKSGAETMRKLRKKTVKGCFGNKKLADRMIAYIIGDPLNPGGFVVE